MSALIYKKMSEVMSSIGSVGKDQKNVAQGFKFRGIDQFVNALHPALNKAGVFMTPRVVSASQTEREVTRSNGKAGVDKTVNLMVEYDFYAEDGSKVTVGPIAAEGLDSGDKATNKALSAALKYALIQTFSVPTEDMVDADSDSPTLAPKQTASNVTIAQIKTVAPSTETVISNISANSNSAINVSKAELSSTPAPKSFRKRSTTTTQEDAF